ncbi:NlpC/P60 family protein [Nonomuraea sp. NPDC050663]|uniref:C40 family peptidase n=1 Tax=Nonomuraea sp. NPDC050663 TaxID=3364370 RepID=UPI0037A8FF9D
MSPLPRLLTISGGMLATLSALPAASALADPATTCSGTVTLPRLYAPLFDATSPGQGTSPLRVRVALPREACTRNDATLQRLLKRAGITEITTTAPTQESAHLSATQWTRASATPSWPPTPSDRPTTPEASAPSSLGTPAWASPRPLPDPPPWAITRSRLDAPPWADTPSRLDTTPWASTRSRLDTPPWASTRSRPHPPSWASTRSLPPTPPWAITRSRLDTPPWGSTRSRPAVPPWAAAPWHSTVEWPIALWRRRDGSSDTWRTLPGDRPDTHDGPLSHDRALPPERHPRRPDVTHPDVTHPDVTHPDVTRPDITRPDITRPVPHDSTPRATPPKPSRPKSSTPKPSTPKPSTPRKPAPRPAKPSTTKADLAVTTALRELGTPFSWGGGSPSGATKGIGRGASTIGFDCSGLTLYAWSKAGVKLGHYTGTQFRQGRRIPLDDLRKGDLVFFGGGTGDPTHVGLYLGNGVMIHAPKTGDVVKKTQFLNSTYYRPIYRGAVRPG